MVCALFCCVVFLCCVIVVLVCVLCVSVIFGCLVLCVVLNCVCVVVCLYDCLVCVLHCVLCSVFALRVCCFVWDIAECDLSVQMQTKNRHIITTSLYCVCLRYVCVLVVFMICALSCFVR